MEESASRQGKADHREVSGHPKDWRSRYLITFVTHLQHTYTALISNVRSYTKSRNV